VEDRKMRRKERLQRREKINKDAYGKEEDNHEDVWGTKDDRETRTKMKKTMTED
jgi:hypothetical protein